MKKLISMSATVFALICQDAPVMAEDLGACPGRLYSKRQPEKVGKLDFHIPSYTFSKISSSALYFNKAELTPASSRGVNCYYGEGKFVVYTKIDEAYSFRTCKFSNDKGECTSQNPEKECRIECSPRGAK